MRYAVSVVLGSLALAAACAAPEDPAGDVVGYNGNMVIIEGVMNRPDGTDVEPTPAMLASAADVCGRPARFTSWDDEAYGGGAFKSTGDDIAMATYRFLCR